MTKQLNEKLSTTPEIDALYTLHIMSHKLALISYAINQAVTPQNFKIEINESALCGIVTLIEEMEHNVGELTDYCQEAENELYPLKEDLQRLHPNAARLFGLFTRYDKDHKIQNRLLEELNAKEAEGVKS